MSKNLTVLKYCIQYAIYMPDTPFSPVQPSGLSDQVIAQIRAAIITGRLQPGDHIVEAALTRQMNVSRTPLREALAILEHEGLVVSYPNRGFFVRTFTEQDVEELFSLRTALENFAGSLNLARPWQPDFSALVENIDAQRSALQQGNPERMRSLDMDFHRSLVALTGHKLLLNSWQMLVAQIAALLCIRAEMISSDESLALDDHTRILECYREKNLARLCSLNEEINQRVNEECQRSLRLWRVRYPIGERM